MKTNEEILNPKIIAYIRVSTDKQTVENQEHEINRYCIKEKLTVAEFIRVEVSGVAKQRKRKIDILFNELNNGDTLICSELSRLGRSMQDILSIVNLLTQRGVRLIFIKQSMDLHKDSNDMNSKIMLAQFALMAEIERDLIQLRTIEALKSKTKKERAKKGDYSHYLGRKTGSLSVSIYDIKDNDLLTMFNAGASATSISRLIGFGTPKTLLQWKKSRIEKNELLDELVFNDKYKKFAKVQKEKREKELNSKN